jgi:hypothetical protein
MSKRLCLLSAGLVAIVAASIPACGGSSSDEPGTGGSGGVLMEGGADTSADNTAPDTSNPDTSVPDVSQEPDATQVDVQILEGSLFDMSLDGTIGDTGLPVQGCYDCSATKCTDELAACNGDDKCRTLILCIFQDGCIDGSGQMGFNQNCLLTCAGKAGISNPQDPSVSLLLGYLQCVNGECSMVCGLPDGGIQIEAGPDAPKDTAQPDVIDLDVIPPTDSGPAPDVVNE